MIFKFILQLQQALSNLKSRGPGKLIVFNQLHWS